MIDKISKYNLLYKIWTIIKNKTISFKLKIRAWKKISTTFKKKKETLKYKKIIWKTKIIPKINNLKETNLKFNYWRNGFNFYKMKIIDCRKVFKSKKSISLIQNKRGIKKILYKSLKRSWAKSNWYRKKIQIIIIDLKSPRIIELRIVCKYIIKGNT